MTTSRPIARPVARQAAALATAAAAVFAALLIAGCNTVSGLGQDLQDASENTSEAIGNAVNN